MAEAAGLQAVLLKITRDDPTLPPEVAAEDMHRMGVILFALKEFASAASHFRRACELHPDHLWARMNEGLCLIRVQRMQEAVAALREAEVAHPENTNLLDGMAEAYGALGQEDACRAYGERSLKLKDAAAFAGRGPEALSQLASRRHPAGRHDVIAFSLFGDRAIYLDGALRNARVAPYVYPGWRCRFYCDDSIPEPVRSELEREGAEIVLMQRPERPTEALFWRFLVAEDPKVRRFLIRDCDSVINIRERAAVGEWQASGKRFHIMRDHPAHSDLLLAGMWGGVAGFLPTLEEMLRGFSYKPSIEGRNADQLFLGRVIWPMIKQDCMIHDRVYRVFGARPFPPGFELPGRRHVGDNDSARRAAGMPRPG
jgi:tetratricopeptide (TPR) repeat protein